MDRSCSTRSRVETRERSPGGSKEVLGSLWHVLQVSADGRFVYVREGRSPVRVDCVEILTGRRVTWKTLEPRDRAGIGAIYPPYITPDGTAYAYSHGEWLQDLYLAEVLRF